MIVKKIKAYLKKVSDQNMELIWANVWRDTCMDIKWIQGISSLSPGRSAVGYNYLYVMTRILNELEPHHVLDLGLGISSTLISNYFAENTYDDALHIICEHDKEWGEFYSRKHSLSEYSHIAYQELTTKRNNGFDYSAYKDLGKDIGQIRFSVISIDAPFGYMGGDSSRRDILEFLPNILEKHFAIVIDDYERIGEQNTVRDIEQILKSNDIPYRLGIYPGLSYVCVVASEQDKFLCTL